MTATKILDELAFLARRSVGARACLAEFLDQNPEVATLEIDEAATRVTGEAVYTDKPSDGLLACLAASRAADRNPDRAAAVTAHS